MNDITAISGIKNRDERTINEVIVKYSKLLWPIASAVLKNVGSEQDVGECIADVFIDLWENPEKYNPERGTLKTWLCMVTRCKAIDRYRMLSKLSTVPLEGAMMVGRMGMQDAFLQEETKRELVAAMNALADVEKDILIRRYYYEQKPREIIFSQMVRLTTRLVLKSTGVDLQSGLYPMTKYNMTVSDQRWRSFHFQSRMIFLKISLPCLPHAWGVCYINN